MRQFAAFAMGSCDAVRGLVRRSRLIAFAVLLCGTTACMAGRMSQWLDHTDADLIGSWGAPNLETSLANGGRVLTWIKEVPELMIGTAKVPASTCRQSFTISATGTVLSYSDGCWR